MHLEILSVLLLLKTVEILCYDVLSHKKPAFQSATLSWIGSEANSAVDGNLATCARTDVIGSNSQQDRTWWYVDLGDIYSVYNIRIHFEDIGKAYILRQRGRFAGFSLYLSSSTIKENGYMCYKDGPELPPLNFTTNCTGYGRYVIYYNERLNGVKYPAGYESMSYTQLCEVVVKGCSRGKFGINCTMNCPTNCCGGKCDIINGKCMECKPGWEGEKCQTFCLKGSYGQDCKFRCSGHCRDGTSCDHVTGECAEGCVSGWTGSICNKTCETGHYGMNCSSACIGHCYRKEPCNKETGHCDSGCSVGYTGALCQRKCTPGWFGENCRGRCSGHCADKVVCNHVDGMCPHGCDDGYTGQNCTNPCPLKYYGRNCSSLCSSKCKDACRHTDGFCTCSPGWMNSPFCNTKCLPNMYGENCAHICSPNCANFTCDRFNGSCLTGCKEPFYGDRCNLGQIKLAAENLASDCDSLTWIVMFVISVTLNTVGCVACVFSKRKRIAQVWNDIRGNSETYMNRTNNKSVQDDDVHNYQELDVSVINEKDYINFQIKRD